MPADRKSPTKARNARKPSASPRKKPEIELSRPPPPPPPELYSTPITNSLYHNIVLRTISHALAKNMDWHQMSKDIASDVGTSENGKGKAKQLDQMENEGEKKQQKKGELTGLELHDHFHHTIYPALKAGVPIWLSKVEPITVSPTTSVEGSDELADATEDESNKRGEEQ